MSKEKNQNLLSKKEGAFELTFKIIVLGDSFVGKSCLALKAVNGTFPHLYKSTVGFEFFNYSVNIDNYNIKFQIRDTCGQEIYRSLISSFYHSSSLAILVYSIDKIQSFNNLIMWLKEIRAKGDPDMSIILIGNKADLENKREVTKEMANEMCENNNINCFLETSAKSGLNIQKIFLEAAKLLLEQHKKHYNMRFHSTESMKNVAIETKIFNKDTIKKIKLNETENTFNKRRNGCCK